MGRIDIGRYRSAREIIPGSVEYREFCRSKLRPLRIKGWLLLIFALGISGMPYAVFAGFGVFGQVLGVAMSVGAYILTIRGWSSWYAESDRRIREMYDIPEHFRY